MNINKAISQLKEMQHAIETHKDLKAKESNIKQLQCISCENWIDDELEEHYYYCEIHNNVFCNRCARNFYCAKIDFVEAPKCPNKFYDKEIGFDCIYQKRFLKYKEKEDDN